MLSRPLPLITHRIPFSVKVLSTNPIITPRIEFAARRPIKSNGPTRSQPLRELTPSVTGSDEEDQDQSLFPNSDGESDLTSLPEDDEGIRPAKIPKPAGEPGRPRSGGFNIEEVLGPWGKEEFTKVNRYTKELADIELDNTKSYSKQNSNKVTALCKTVERRHAIIQKYEDHWPVRAMLKLYLKATSEHHRRSGKGSNDEAGKAP